MIDTSLIKNNNKTKTVAFIDSPISKTYARCTKKSETFEIQISCNVYMLYLPAGRSLRENILYRKYFETETKYFPVRTDLDGK